MKIVIVFALILLSPLFAGKYVAEFLEIGVGVRAAGMGSAYTASGDDASAFWWNPASLARKIVPQAYLMHAAMYGNMYELDAISYRDKLFGGYYGVSLFRLATDDIPFTRENGFYDYGPDGIPGTGDLGEGNGVWDAHEPIDATAIDMRTEGSYALMLATAFPVSKNLSWGIAGKILHQRIGDYTNFGIGADIGLRYDFCENLRIGLSVLDVTGTHLNWSTGFSESKLPSVRLGAYRRDTLIEKKLFLASTADLEMRFEGASDDALISVDPVTIDPHIGVEFSLYDRFFTRIGLDRNDFTAGAGLRIARFTIDYAFVAASSDYVHRVGLTVDFDPRLPPGVQRD